MSSRRPGERIDPQYWFVAIVAALLLGLGVVALSTGDFDGEEAASPTTVPGQSTTSVVGPSATTTTIGLEPATTTTIGSGLTSVPPTTAAPSPTTTTAAAPTTTTTARPATTTTSSAAMASSTTTTVGGGAGLAGQGATTTTLGSGLAADGTGAAGATTGNTAATGADLGVPGAFGLALLVLARRLARYTRSVTPGSDRRP